MLIDWFTVGAQALNFIILVWLMRRFLYRPILDAIDARERRIATELADAAAKQAEAERERDDFRNRNEAFDRERAARLKEVADEAKAERQRLLDEARQAADALGAKRQKALADEARSLDQAVTGWAREEVFAIARKALSDLTGTALEAQLVDVFVDRVRAIDGAAKTTLADALQAATGPAVVRSAFDLPAPQRKLIRDAINETFGVEVDLTFETAPELIGGLEFATDGRKLAWSIDDYLASLEGGVGELLAEQTRPVPPSEIRPGSAHADEPANKDRPTHKVEARPRSRKPAAAKTAAGNP